MSSEGEHLGNPVTETQQPEPAKPKRLIGSQRDPGNYVPKPSIPVVAEKPQTATYPPEPALTSSEIASEKPEIRYSGKPKREEQEDVAEGEFPDRLSRDGEKKLQQLPPKPIQHITIPKYRNGKMSADLEAEFEAVFGGKTGEIDSLIKGTEATAQAVLEPDTKVNAKVLSIQQDNVFLDLGTKEQGVAALKLFPPDKEPSVGEEIEVTIVRFLRDEGLYEATVPLAAFDVKDWSQVQEGMVVEALITKTNAGGLECQVNSLRGFIPISQIEIFRVENTEQYIGQKLTCVVEEVNFERRNLVLSRKSLLIRQREEERSKLLDELEAGQVREGLVRKIIDAGAFVDLGGVDGFIPIGAMSWGRIRHPSDVLSEGTRVKVRISKIDEAGSRISLVYRDDASNPWLNITERFQEKTLARGKVSRITDFGAFIELMPGVEGLVHISELANKRVNNVKEVVQEGDWVDVYIISVDPVTRRIALSVKQALPPEPEPVNEEKPDVAEEQVTREPLKIKNSYKGTLKGGTGASSGGAFGLKW